MTTDDRTRYAREEQRDIHVAACRYRAQGLVCSTCCELAERAARRLVDLNAQGYRVVNLWETDIRRYGARSLLEKALAGGP